MTSQWHGGKGSAPRPFSVSQEEWESRWDAIFQRDKKEVSNSEAEEKLTRFNDETREVKEKFSS